MRTILISLVSAFIFVKRYRNNLDPKEREILGCSREGVEKDRARAMGYQ